MPLVTFVILHYFTVNLTINCINSILNKLTYHNYKIVVVDNGSTNNSGKTLKDLYERNPKVHIICLQNNLGFSAGNNVGYLYAKDNLHAEFIIVINNDTEMIQEDFIQKAIDCYYSTLYYVLGPDIIDLDGAHQNPRRNHIITKSEANKMLLREYIAKGYLVVHKFFNLSNKLFQIIERNKVKIKSNISNEIDMNKEVTLQGACFVFSPLFVDNSTFAFEELSFMYGEEDLLAIRCKRNDWKTLYNSELQILHAEQATTKMIYSNLVDKKIFNNANLIKAAKEILIKLNE